MAQFSFIGVDLAWKSVKNPSGVAVLLGDDSGVGLEGLVAPVHSLAAVLDLMREHLRGTTIVAIDAPLIVRNISGQRPCETSVGNRYGARDASCHTSNLTLYPKPASVELARALSQDGFVHANCGATSEGQRVMMEVFPHAALVALFDLTKIIKYKKGRIEEKRVGLRQLCSRIRDLAGLDPPLLLSPKLDQVLSQDLSVLRGCSLKHYEDGLDAIVCAYLASYYWRWGAERNERFGDLTSGYILNPRLRGT